MSALAPAFPSADRIGRKRPLPFAAPRADHVVRTCALANGAERREHYDLSGRLVLQEEPDGTWLRCRYDAEGNLSAVEHSSGEEVDYRIDHSKRGYTLHALTDRTETVIGFDESGQPVEVVQRVDGREWVTRFRRDAGGRVTGLLYPQAADWTQIGAEVACGTSVYANIRAQESSDTTEIAFATGATSIETIDHTTGKQATLRHIAHADRDGRVGIDLDYSVDADGRLASAGEQSFEYDDAGRLTRASDYIYRFDAAGNRCESGECGERTTFAYDADAPFVRSITELSQRRFTSLEYDTLGRRIARVSSEGTTRYAYNLFGQLQSVILPDGRRIEYVYDGLGRLVARELHTPNGQREIEYVIPDLEGHRLAEADDAGRIMRSYIWLGPQCIARIDGPMGNPLAETYHRVHGGRLAAVGDVQGHLRPIAYDDPYGRTAPITPGRAGYAGLFGDADTGLLLAGSRWLDPAIGQFLTPDSWFGTHAVNPRVSPTRRLSTILAALPGGAGRKLDARTAYVYCAHDPINFTDPTGHNWLGLIYSFIASMLWSQQITAAAFQLEAINVVLDLAQILIGRPIWDTDGYWNNSIFNIAPPVASYRLMVPWALILNGLTRGPRTWTLGNVIWTSGKELRKEESVGARSLIECSNTSDYLAARAEIPDTEVRARSKFATGTATVDSTGQDLINLAVTAPAKGAATGAAIWTGTGANGVAIRLPAAPAGVDEVRMVGSASSTTTSLPLSEPPLPSAYFNQPVEIVRLDPVYVRIEHPGDGGGGGGDVTARTITSVRGQTIHHSEPMPEKFPNDGLTITELMRTGVPKDANVNVLSELLVLRLGKNEDQPKFPAGALVRVRGQAKFRPGIVARPRATRDLVLTEPLDSSPSATKFDNAEVARMDDTGNSAAGQSADNDIIGAGNLSALKKLDGLVITDAAGALVVRSFVVQLMLSCPMTPPLPTALHNQSLIVERLTTDTASFQVAGKVSSTTVIADASDTVSQLKAGDAIAVSNPPAKRAFNTIASVAGKQITLDDPLPAADFPNGVAVTIHPTTAGSRIKAEPVKAPGDRLLIDAETTADVAVDDALRVRVDASGGAVRARRLDTAPTVAARVDSPIPGAPRSGLTVRHFAEADKSDGAEALMVLMRFTVTSAVNPFAAGNEVIIDGKAWGKVLTSTGADVTLTDPIEYDLSAGSRQATAVEPTGASTTGTKLGEGLVLIPSDLGEDPVTIRRAVELHEMRHVWQYAILGPFFHCLPIPWLVNLGFSLTPIANSGSRIVRHVSFGGLDSLIAVIAWGIGGHQGPTELAGTLGADHKTVTFAADAERAKLERFKPGAHAEVVADHNLFNVIDTLDVAAHRVILRFELPADKFPVGATVNVSVSVFEEYRRKVSTFFSLNLHNLWIDHIPQSWGRALAQITTRDAWLPPLGLFPMSLMIADSQDQLALEQDASYQSGDLYTSMALADPATVFVGQFSRVFAHVSARSRLIEDFAVSSLLRIGVSPVAKVEDSGVGGAFPSNFDPASNKVIEVRLRADYHIPLADRLINTFGAFFVSTQPGTYKLHSAYDLEKRIVGGIVFDAGFDKRRTLIVKDIGVTPDPTVAVFETERVTFSIVGDPAADYALRYAGTPPAKPGAISGLTFTVPTVAASPPPHKLQITAKYDRTDAVFSGPGQSGTTRLTDEQLTNVCKSFDLNVNPLVAPAAIPAVESGATTTFKMDIPPTTVKITSARPAGAVTDGSVTSDTSRPATITFMSPIGVASPSDVTVQMVFGSGSVDATVTINVTIRVNPKTP